MHFLLQPILKIKLPFLILYRLSEVFHFLYIMESGIRCATEFFFQSLFFFWLVVYVLYFENKIIVISNI